MPTRHLFLAWLDADDRFQLRRLDFDAARQWIAIGTSADCDIVIEDDPAFPQLGFQVNWHPDREPFLYSHPAWLGIGTETVEATSTDSIFPLRDEIAIWMKATRTVFLLTRNEFSDGATAVERLGAVRDRLLTALPEADSPLRLGCAAPQSACDLG